MARALSALVLSLLGVALLTGRTARADGDADAAWNEERRAALKAALHEAEEKGEERRAADLRKELEAMGRRAKEGKAAKEPASLRELELRLAEYRSRASGARAKGSAMDADEGTRKAAAQEAEEWARKASAVEQVLGVRRESEELERKGHDLQAAGRVDEAQAVMRRAGETWKRSLELEAEADGRRRDKGGDPAQARIEHLRAAAKHLKEAGMGDLAERVANAAREAEEQVAKARAEAQARDAAAGGEIQALRAQVAELQKMIEDLKARLDKKP